MQQPAHVAEPARQGDASLRAVALALFDHAAHELPARLRKVLDLAAACYAAALRAGDDRPERLGRDMVLAAPANDLDTSDLAIAASAVAFQRDKLRSNREPASMGLDRKQRRQATRLAAILRVATALGDGALRVSAEGDDTTVIVGGERAADRIAAAEARAELWRKQLGPLLLRAGALAEAPPLHDNGSHNGAALNGAGTLDLPAAGPMTGGEPATEAIRRVLRRFFDRLLARENDVAKGEDAEDVHQMRVATRRLRASLQVAEGLYDPALIRRFRRGLQQIARSLGQVRDCDVFLAHVVAYAAGLPEERRDTLAPLLSALAAERAAARKQLLGDLKSKRYRKLKREFAAFLTTPAAGALPQPEPGITQRVRDFAGSALWRRYELWRAYETIVDQGNDEPLHQSRIAGKRLRYTLELFADALGPNVSQALDPLVALQECLGELQDGVTARAHVAALGLADDAGAQAYLADRDAERGRYLAELPARWEKVDSATYRRRLFELIVKM